MIAGGSSWEALRYGVSSDTGHRGLVIQEGIGLFGGGIVDQNLLGGNRLGRLIVACAEESERFGDRHLRGQRRGRLRRRARALEAAGRHGFLLVEIDPTALVLQSDSFVADGIRLTVLAPGDASTSPAARSRGRSRPRRRPALLGALLDGLAREAGGAERRPTLARRSPRSAG